MRFHMINYKYTITKEFGIHARPAFQLAKNANDFTCSIQIGKADQMADAKDVMEIMGIKLMQGDEMRVTFNGTDEDKAANSMINLIKEHL